MGGKNNTDDRKMWVIRPGKNSEALSLFLKSGVIALKATNMGDLKKINKTREAFYDAYKRCDPNNTSTGISGIGGKYFRFVHEVSIDDYVLVPSHFERQVYFGIIKSNYKYAPQVDKDFSHQRDVQWKLSFDKLELSEFAKRELGAARTFFRYKTNIEEIMSFIGDEDNNEKIKRPPFKIQPK